MSLNLIASLDFGSTFPLENINKEIPPEHPCSLSSKSRLHPSIAKELGGGRGLRSDACGGRVRGIQRTGWIAGVRLWKTQEKGSSGERGRILF